MGGSFTAVFADQDINGLLTSWFQQKKDESIEKIDAAILAEQQQQTKRLEEALKVEIAKAEQRLDEKVENEILERTKALQQYSNQLIQSMKESKTKELDQAILSELDQIVQEAKAKMENIKDTPATNEESNTQP